jgi:cob(I)alamin adenosyltransferase
MRIYTRGGDKGETSLFDGSRISKADLRVEAYGAVDELNAVVSWARIVSPKDVAKVLERIQNELFTVGADLATPLSSSKESKRVTPAMSAAMEPEIDRFMSEVGTPEGFVLPGETEEGARLHVARTVCRRAERLVVLLAGKAKTNAEVVTYLNRLSDLLYACAVWTDKVARGRTLRNPRYGASS